MAQNLAALWRTVEEQESAHEFEAARDTYHRIVQVDPTQAFAWLRLGIDARRRGRYLEARESLLQGLDAALRHGRWRAFSYLTMHLLAFDERRIVQDAIERADWSDRRILEQSAVLTQQLWLADAHESALRHVELAVRHAQGSHRLAYVHGMVLKYLGRMDEATACFERSIGLDAGFADAHWALAYHARSVPPGKRIARIQDAMRRAADDGLEQAYLGYALFKEYDDAGETERAWQSLERAAQIKRGLVQHDAMREARAIGALPGMPADIGMDPGALNGRQPSPIFIVGMPRTGTTLLERMLGNHSQVSGAGELNAFTASLSMALDQFCSTPLDAQASVQLAGRDLRGVGEEYRRRTSALAAGKARFTDKNPSNVFHAGLIARALPDARIVCMRRSPMDACFSNLKELFAGDAHAYSYDQLELASHFNAYSKLVARWRRELGDRFMVVDYEDLVENPSRTAMAVLDFCGLQREPGCEQILDNRSPVSTASSSQVREPIHSRGIGAWERYARWLEPLSAALEPPA